MRYAFHSLYGATIAVTLMLLTAFAIESRAGDSSEAPRKPNIVLIMVDDMGYGDLGCYGQEHYDTPHLDALADQGVRFTQAYSGSSVCAPARSTLMTGQHMGHTPVRGNSGGIPLPSKAVTMAEVLKKAGYATGGFGKWGLGDICTEGAAEKQGFDTFYGYYDQVHAHSYYPSYLILNGKHSPLPGNRHYKVGGNGGAPVRNKADTAVGQFSHYLIFERMIQFISNHQDERFFCYAPWTPPHGKYTIPKTDPAWLKVKDWEWPTKAKVHAAFNLLIDRHVGRTVETLEQLGLRDETLVIFTSDHGPAKVAIDTLNSNGKFKGHKRSMHEGGLRVPFLAHLPGHLEGGRVVDQPTYFPDLLPTFAELAGAERFVPENVDGLSIAPTLTNKGNQPQHAGMYWEWPKAWDFPYGEKPDLEGPMMQAYRRGDWKLLRNDAKKPWQLYNLARDPAEKNNLAGTKPGIVKSLAQQAKAAREEMPPQKEPESDGPYR